MTEVTAAVIQKDGKILICQRPQGKNLEYLWEFPGGKVEPGESLEACLQRELKEELDITVHNLSPLRTIERGEAGLRIHFFTCQLDSSHDPARLEHNALAWIDSSDFDTYTFCPSDEMLLLTTDPEDLFCTEGKYEGD